MRRPIQQASLRAFTLIELLLVIAIISALAAVLFPVFITARAKAAQATCLSNLHQIGQAITLYSSDYDDYLPYAPNCGVSKLLLQGRPVYGDPLDATAKGLPDIKAVLAPYKASDLLFRCPWDHQTPEIVYPAVPSTWFEASGSSYQYNDWNALRSVPLNSFSHPANDFLMGDQECYHDRAADTCGFFNVLHMDFHVKSLTLTQREEVIDNTEGEKSEP